jgi:hypothetical protein
MTGVGTRKSEDLSLTDGIRKQQGALSFRIGSDGTVVSMEMSL